MTARTETELGFKPYITQAEFYDVISEQHDFRNGGGFRVWRDLYWGQERATNEIVDFLKNAPHGSIVFVEAPFGAGKTTLSFAVEQVLAERGLFPEQEFGWSAAWQIPDLDKSHIIAGGRNLGKDDRLPNVLWLDEVGRETSRREVEEEFEAIGKLLEREVQYVVVTSSNHVTKNSDLLKKIGSPKAALFTTLDPLTPERLGEILKLRFRKALGDRVLQIDWGNVFEDEFIQYLVPKTDPLLPDLRSVMSLIVSMADHLPYARVKEKVKHEGERKLNDEEREILKAAQNEPFKLGSEQYLKYKGSMPLDRRWEWDQHDRKDKREIIIRLAKYIHDTYDGTRPFRALSSEELASVCAPDISIDEFRKLHLFPRFDLHGIVRATGIPYLKDNRYDHPEPYLPDDQTLFLHAKYAPIPEIQTK